MIASATATPLISLLQQMHGLSNLLAAAVMTRRSRRDMRWTRRANALSLAIAAPALLVFCFADSLGVALVALGVATLCSGFQIGPFVAALQSAAQPCLRALTGAWLAHRAPARLLRAIGSVSPTTAGA